MADPIQGKLILKRVDPEKEELVIEYLSGLFKTASRAQIEKRVAKTPMVLVKHVPEAKVAGVMAKLSSLGATVEFLSETPTPPPPESPVEGTQAASAQPDAVPCSQCGRPQQPDEMIQYNDLWVCADCKPTVVQKLKEGEFVGSDLNYAGFWIRAGAKIIDWIVIAVIGWVLSFLVILASGLSGSEEVEVIASIVSSVLNIVIAAGYATWFIGKYAATPGKMACGLRIVMPDSEPVSYARALGRYFAEWISSMIFGIGYFMAIFDDEKRTLHDRICSTRVVKK